MKKIPLGRFTVFALTFPVALFIIAGLYVGIGSFTMMIHTLNSMAKTERTTLALKLDSLLNSKFQKRLNRFKANLSTCADINTTNRKSNIIKNYWYYSRATSKLTTSDSKFVFIASNSFDLSNIDKYLKEATNEDKSILSENINTDNFISNPLIFGNCEFKHVIYIGQKKQSDSLLGFTINMNAVSNELIQPLLQVFDSSFDYVVLRDDKNRIVACSGNENSRDMPVLQSKTMEGILKNYKLEIKGKKTVFNMPGNNTLLMLVLGMIIIVLSFLAFVIYLYWFGRNKEEKLSLKNDWLLNMAHVIQGPIHSIKIATEILPNSDQTVKTKLFALINSNLQKLEIQVRQYLQLGRIYNSNIKLTKQVINVNEIVTTEIDTISRMMMKKINFDVKTDKDDNLKVETDKDSLIMILDELFINAVKYSDENSNVNVKLSVSDSEVIVEVKDNGMGISSDEIDKIWQPFYRVQNSDTESISGSGLGIYLSKRMSERINANLTISSDGHKTGTTAKLRIPKM